MKKPTKIINNIYPALLILLGSFLEIYFYYKRFVQDGVNNYVSCIIAVALTILLTILARYYKTKIIYFLIIPLALFSVFTTSAGQAFSLSVERNKTIETSVGQLNIQDQIEEYKNDIAMINQSLKNLQNVTAAEDKKDQWKYSGVIKSGVAREKELKKEKVILQEKLNNLRDSQTVRTETVKEETDIYKFYNGLFGISPKWLQFILQTILSFFIAVMSPIGIIILTTKKGGEEVIFKPKIGRERIGRFVSVSFAFHKIGDKAGKKANRILTEGEFFDVVSSRIKQGKKEALFTKSEYKYLRKLLMKNNIVDNSGKLLYTDSDKVVDILDNIINKRGTK